MGSAGGAGRGAGLGRAFCETRRRHAYARAAVRALSRLHYCISPLDSSNPGCTAGEMMDRDFPRNWMWSQACETLARAERLNRELFRPLGAVARSPAWEPPVDMLETEREVLVLVALPGVDPDQVEAALDGSDLIVARTRILPRELPPAIIHRLELPQGRFERRLPLPAGRYSAVRRSAIHGSLLIPLHKLLPFLVSPPFTQPTPHMPPPPPPPLP